VSVASAWCGLKWTYLSYAHVANSFPFPLLHPLILGERLPLTHGVHRRSSSQGFGSLVVKPAIVHSWLRFREIIPIQVGIGA